MLFLECMLDIIHKISVVDWTSKIKIIRLYILLFKCKKSFEDIKLDRRSRQSYLYTKFKRTPMYANMVEYMLPKILNDTIRECKWEALKEIILSSTKKCFLIKRMP
mgnify:CR=1 FL=1